MKNQLLSFVVLLSSISFLSAQSITGKIIDDKGKGIFYATVALYQKSDSSFVKGYSTEDDGSFEFKALENNDYYIESSMIGYTAKITDVNISDGQNLSLDITLEEDANLLETVEIVDKMPLLEQRADKLIVNVEGNVTNTSGSLLDVMKKVPGMLVINDRLSMVGSGSPTILLNGKSTQYMDVQSLLRDMPGDNIKKVEIIHQPGSEYEASGSGPIINIILKKNSLFGTNGNVTLGVGKGELWDYTTGLNLSHYSGGLNINGGVGYSRNAWVDRLYLTRTLSDISETIDGQYVQLNDDQATPTTYRGNLRVDWDMTEKHRIGIETKYYSNTNRRITPNTTTVDLLAASQQDYELLTDNDIDRSWQYNAINPYYIFEIDTSGQKLELDVSAARYKVDGQNTLSTSSSLNTDTLRQRYVQPGDTKIFATALDYTKPINKNIELKVGAKYSKADLDNDLQSTFWDEGQWVNNPLQSNRYLFTETIYAGYGKVNWNKNDWNGTVGLRYEDSESVGESITLDSILTRPIKKFFPSFSVARKVGGGLTAGVSYSYRINRPRYSSLNSFVYYLDPFTYEKGNQNLQPELTHSTKFTLSMDGQPFFNIEYKKASNAIVEVTQQEADSEEAFKTDVNFDDRTIFSTSLFFPLDFIPGLSGYGGTIVSRNMYDSPFNGDSFQRSIWNTTVVLQAEFKLPWDINAELGGWYTSANQEGIFNSEWLYGTEFGMSKKFMDGKIKASLGIEDPFNKFWFADVDFQQNMQINSEWQTPVVNARFSYKFGNQHLKSKKKSATSASEELRRASQGE